MPVEGKPSAERIVVVSPHFDDGVLSLGASIASWCRAGATVLLLTVFGCDPDSTAPSGGWDRRGGFGTEGESARARREEDRLACAVLGATSVQLPFGSVDYERHGEDGDVRAAVAPAVEGADLVLLPGFPLQPSRSRLARADVGVRLQVGYQALLRPDRALRRTAVHTPSRNAAPRACLARRACRARGVRAYSCPPP